MVEFPAARRGLELTVAMWEAARAYLLRTRLLEGPGIRLQWTSTGTIISATAKPTPWNHPFRSTLRGQSGAVILPGYVNGSIVPEIDEIPLTGTEKEAPPALEWSRLSLAGDGTGYIVIELQGDEKWNLVLEHPARILQVAYFDRDDDDPNPPPATVGTGAVPLLPGRRARVPIARLTKTKEGKVSLFQILQGDVQFRAQPRTAGSEEGRGFYW